MSTHYFHVLENKFKIDSCEECLMKTCDECHIHLEDHKFYKYNQETCKECLLKKDKNTDMETLKTCKKCNTDRPIYYYKINKKGKIGATCKHCLYIAAQALKAKRAERHRRLHEYFDSEDYQNYGSEGEPSEYD